MIGLGGKHGEDGVILGQAEVVHQRTVRRLEPLFGLEVALAIGDEIRDVVGAETALSVREKSTFMIPR